jgi:hypothetical protein
VKQETIVSKTKLPFWLLPFLVTTNAALADTVTNASASHQHSHFPGEQIRANGAFSCDFTFDFAKITEPAGAAIERDRILMQRFVLEFTDPDSPGMLQKHIPFLPTSPATALAGGRYLFQSRAQARKYEKFVTELYTYPAGTQFLSRPEFADPECRDWSVIEAWNFASIDTHVAFRTERFDTGRVIPRQEKIVEARLRFQVPRILDEARHRGYAEVHVLHQPDDHKVQLVYFISRMSELSPSQPDAVALEKISTDSPLGDRLASRLNLTRVFDQSMFVLNVWQPYLPGDQGEASLWPNSPPFPEGACGDNVCVPSQGEHALSCAVDCTGQCGNAICDAGEDLDRCPSDCEIPIAGNPAVEPPQKRPLR